MSLSREALEALDRIGVHPALVALAEQAPPGIDVPAVARSLARRLVGAPLDDDEEDPLARLFFAIAGAELSLLAGHCRDEPLKAVIATIALLQALIPRYPGDSPDKGKPAEGSDGPPMSGFSARRGRPRDDVRKQLEQLSRKPLPDDLPMPRLDRIDVDDPVRMAAQLADEMDVDDAAGAAWSELEKNEDVIDTLSRLVPGFGWDFSPGELGQTLLHNLPSLAALLDKLPALQRICDELGRMEGKARKQSDAHRGGREEVVGVRVGGELSDVLPVELALLGAPVTEDLFYQRLVEHRLMSLELQGTALAPQSEGDKRGPIIACIDTSGSMQGAPEEVAKALVLSLARQARRKRRPVRLLLFGGPGEITVHELRPDRVGLTALLEFLAMGFNAGTDFDGPLRRAAEMLDDDVFDKADILVVTDGYGSTTPETRRILATARHERGFRILSVVVGGDPHGVGDFSDEVWLVDGDSELPGGIDVRSWKPD